MRSRRPTQSVRELRFFAASDLGIRLRSAKASSDSLLNRSTLRHARGRGCARRTHGPYRSVRRPHASAILLALLHCRGGQDAPRRTRQAPEVRQVEHLESRSRNGQASSRSSRAPDDARARLVRPTAQGRARLVFLSGQVAWDENSQVVGDTYAEQATQAIRNLEVALRAAGSDFGRVLRLRVYVRGEIGDHMEAVMPPLLKAFSRVRPSVTGIGVASHATPDTLIELEAVAQRIGAGR